MNENMNATIPYFIMLVGLPASGKSTYANLLSTKYNAKIHSSDEIRKELSGDINNQNINDIVFKTLHKRIKQDLANNQSCIYDATNINYKRRMGFLQELNKIPCKKICMLIATPYEECIKNNSKRDRVVPTDVIERMYKNFHIPYWYEGWDDIKIIYTDSGYKNYYGEIFDFMFDYKNYNQENHNHNLSLGEHCYCTALHISSIFPDDRLLWRSALLHDCGKPFVKQFCNTKGEKTKDAHYYNHQYVSGYQSLFYDILDCCINKLDIAIRIMWHMQLYFIKEGKTLKKYKKLWGENLYKDLKILHEADVFAH